MGEGSELIKEIEEKVVSIKEKIAEINKRRCWINNEVCERGDEGGSLLEANILHCRFCGKLITHRSTIESIFAELSFEDVGKYKERLESLKESLETVKESLEK